MSYDTGIRKRTAYQAKGIDYIWGSNGTALASAGSYTLLDITGAGELKLVRIVSKSNALLFGVFLDSYDCAEPVREPVIAYATYGSCGRWGGVNLVRYDTVGEKYIMEVYEELAGKFGATCGVGLYNPTGAAINCCINAVYGINASLAVRQDRIDVVKIKAESKMVSSVVRDALAKELGMKPGSITVVKAGQFDWKTKENYETLEVFVHNANEEDKAVEKVVKDFLAQFV